jgi:restriction endonuclease S subunit
VELVLSVLGLQQIKSPPIKEHELKTTIKNIADVWVGYQPKDRAEHDMDGTYRLIQIKDFREDGSINFGSLSWVVPDRDPERYRVQEGDVLFSARGKYNYAYALENVLAQTLAGGNFFVVRLIKRDLLPEYLAWFLNQPVTQEAIKGRMMGTNIPYISKGAFVALEVQMPPLETQGKICQLIRLLQQEKRLLANLAAKRAQLVQAVCYRAAHQG